MKKISNEVNQGCKFTSRPWSLVLLRCHQERQYRVHSKSLADQLSRIFRKLLKFGDECIYIFEDAFTVLLLPE